MNEQHYTVRATACDHTASEEEVHRALARATAPLDRSWGRLARAKRIAIKFNQDFVPSRVIVRHGHRQQLVSDPVVRATLRLLRERTTAELVVVDVGVEGMDLGRAQTTTIAHILDEFGVPYVDGITAPVTWTDVPGGGSLFDRYPVPSAAAEADEVVSVQTVKNHRFAGVTLSAKNLFGLASLAPEGRPRSYYHHLVRLPYVLSDLARVFNPALNILDGIVGQASEEWGPGEYPQDSGVLIAGDQTIATDACTTKLMGHDPTADWLTPPFHRDRNHLLAAAEAGFGTVDTSTIDFKSEVEAPIGDYFAMEYDTRDVVESWIRTTAEQALFYRDNRERLVSRYAGSYILLQMGEVRMETKDGRIGHSRRKLAGDNPEEAMWLKFVDPEDFEGEHFEGYERALKFFDS